MGRELRSFQTGMFRRVVTSTVNDMAKDSSSGSAALTKSEIG